MQNTHTIITKNTNRYYEKKKKQNTVLDLLLLPHELFRTDTTFKPCVKIWTGNKGLYNTTCVPKNKNHRRTKLNCFLSHRDERSGSSRRQQNKKVIYHRFGTKFDHGILSIMGVVSTGRKKTVQDRLSTYDIRHMIGI